MRRKPPCGRNFAFWAAFSYSNGFQRIGRWNNYILWIMNCKCGTFARQKSHTWASTVGLLQRNRTTFPPGKCHFRASGGSIVLGEGGRFGRSRWQNTALGFPEQQKTLAKKGGGMSHHLLSRLCGLTTAKLLRSAMQNEKLAFFFCIALVFP